MSDNLTELIVTETPSNQNPGIPDNLALISAVITIILGGVIIMAAVAMLWRKKTLHRFFRRIKKKFKSSDGVPAKFTIISMTNPVSQLVGEWVDEKMEDAVSIIITWVDKDGGITTWSSENMTRDETCRQLLYMANETSSENGD